jgi:hypothetical protein
VRKRIQYRQIGRSQDQIPIRYREKEGISDFRLSLHLQRRNEDRLTKENLELQNNELRYKKRIRELEITKIALIIISSILTIYPVSLSIIHFFKN